MTNYAFKMKRRSFRALEERPCFDRTWQFLLMKILEYIIIMVIGGLIYCEIEILYRGYTHWSMGIVGGVALLTVGMLNELTCLRRVGIIPQMIMGGILITVIEFISGCIINLWLGWNVWDYSEVPFNILGQICIPFTFAWMLLAGLAIFIDDLIRHELFHEQKVHYHIWKCNC